VLASQLNTVRRIILGTPVAATVMSVAIALVGLVRSLPLTFALYALAGVCMSLVSVTMGTLLLLRIPEPAIGRVTASVTGIHRTSGLVAYGLGGLVVGLLAPESVRHRRAGHRARAGAGVPPGVRAVLNARAHGRATTAGRRTPGRRCWPSPRS
jgi:MFS family permease